MEFPSVEDSMKFINHGIKLADEFVAKSYMSLASNPYLYHYRHDKGVTESIVTKGKFWATHAAHMSDKTELVYGAKLVKSILDEFVALNPDMPWDAKEFLEMAGLHANPYSNEFTGQVDPYFVCFSESGTIESQWEKYAGNSTGYCIEFALPEAYIHPRSEETLALSRSNFLFLKVIYDPAEQRRLVIDAVNDFLTILSAHLNKYGWGAMGCGMSASIGLYYLLCYYVMSFKSPDFVKEQEWRCVYGMSYMKPRTLEVKLRDGKVPYVEAALVSPTGPLIVKSIAKGTACTHGDISTGGWASAVPNDKI